MASTTRGCLFMVMCWYLFVIIVSYERTPELMSFYTIFNGVFTDSDQIKKSHDDHGPVIYIEERVNGQIFRQQLETFVEGKDGLFHVIPYNITEDKAKTLNLDDLSNITLEDLHASKDCDWNYMKAGTGIYAGDKRDCRLGSNAKYSGYRVTVSCNSIHVVVPLVGAENFTSEPYELFRKGKRFPYPNPLDKMYLPCNDTKDE